MSNVLVEWGSRSDFHEVAEALEIPTDCVMAVFVPPGQTEKWALFSKPGKPHMIYRCRLARDHYDVLRPSSEAVPMPVLVENIHAALEDHFG